MKYKVFIDGREGTAGLQIESRLRARDDIELLCIEDSLRKDVNRRRELLNAADVAFLCLPDAAATESAALVQNDKTIVIDASTAHRTDPEWVYGFPELSRAHRERIAQSKRIANPGCHATGFIAAAYPLVAGGYIAKSAALHCSSLTGYSGGGKNMIAQYEAAERPEELKSPRQYALAQAHKHLAEMAAVTGLQSPPVFTPTVCDFYSGMAVTLFLDSSMFMKKIGLAELADYYRSFYAEERLISVADAPESGFLAANELAGEPYLKIYPLGCDGRITVTCVFDNLAKGASGAAIQNMNIALGIDEFKGVLD